MNSKLYLGHVEHIRFLPKKHKFKYPLYVYGMDLDELNEMDKKFTLFGYNRIRPASIHDRDYGTHGKGSIKKKLLDLLENQGIENGINQIILITSARYFNYVFNPVNFYG